MVTLDFYRRVLKRISQDVGLSLTSNVEKCEFFFSLFSYLYIILLERRNPKREIGRSGTIQLCLTRPGPQQ